MIRSVWPGGEASVASPFGRKSANEELESIALVMMAACDTTGKCLDDAGVAEVLDGASNRALGQSGILSQPPLAHERHVKSLVVRLHPPGDLEQDVASVRRERTLLVAPSLKDLKDRSRPASLGGDTLVVLADTMRRDR